jgi:basic membrane lipoprotein Med (substrate-binding protein (PBP1-ABC) superfamily)
MATAMTEFRRDGSTKTGPPEPDLAPAGTVGFIYVGPKDDYGYNQAHHLRGPKRLRLQPGHAEVKKKLAGIKVVEEENVPETKAVQKTMQGMISQDGATLLFPTSFGYFDPHMLAMAAKNGRALRPLRRPVDRGQAPGTPAASSATSTRRSTSTAWSPAT